MPCMGAPNGGSLGATGAGGIGEIGVDGAGVLNAPGGIGLRGGGNGSPTVGNRPSRGLVAICAAVMGRQPSLIPD